MCCKYFNLESHKGLDAVCPGRSVTGRGVENTRHFENLRHPQSSKKQVKLDGPCRPLAETRKTMCK
eukprot:637526-Pyramimonas_sp.AAC.1